MNLSCGLIIVGVLLSLGLTFVETNADSTVAKLAEPSTSDKKPATAPGTIAASSQSLATSLLSQSATGNNNNSTSKAASSKPEDQSKQPSRTAKRNLSDESGGAPPARKARALVHEGDKPALGEAASASGAKSAKDLSTAEGHHGKKYMLVKKKPKHKKIKMEVYKPKMKYKKIKMKVPVKKMKKKKVKGYLVKKEKHHGHYA